MPCAHVEKGPRCASCDRARRNASARARYAKNPEKEREHARRHRRLHPESVNRSVNQWKQRNPDKVKQYDRRKRGIVDAHLFDSVFEHQGRVCEICRTDKPTGKGWCADHDHATGLIRGVLCAHCNVGLGAFKDKPSLMYAAVEYLRACPAEAVRRTLRSTQ